MDLCYSIVIYVAFQEFHDISKNFRIAFVSTNISIF